MNARLTRAADGSGRIELVALDVDGVLTDGACTSPPRQTFKVFHARDGHGIKLLMAAAVGRGDQRTAFPRR